MIERKVSTRYARALFKICEDNGIKQRDALEYLKHFLSIIKENRELSEFLSTRLVPVDRKIKVVDELLSDTKKFYVARFLNKAILEKLFGNDSYFLIKEFVKYMIKRNRYPLLEAVVEIFEELVYQKENRVKALVRSAVELDKKTKDILRDSLETRFKKNIEFTFEVDESLVAGIVIKVDDVVFDGSVNTYLNNLERKLLSLSL